ncbi:hypothetical protein SmJEL517_g03372 [Synchytrium microbalum]|uniref:Dolichyl-diphosphooligosaccharide-protein glycosyltransferase subunit OST5 n=1 Tax=Synchytrium microbalum TaxID=1806994 RepID=A0A507C8N6_9FUNG|nr:uncharacterized protein SmJEL517_g03372 [Synchytrium microbalum]TPX33865.1 hypothetical protein SmJEL517_g03372 [Synchytrium microbalum]
MSSQWNELIPVSNPSLNFALAATILLLIGFAGGSAFLLYEVMQTKSTRSWTMEIGLAALSSLFVGFGTLYLFLAVGIYV